MRANIYYNWQFKRKSVFESTAAEGTCVPYWGILKKNLYRMASDWHSRLVQSSRVHENYIHTRISPIVGWAQSKRTNSRVIIIVVIVYSIKRRQNKYPLVVISLDAGVIQDSSGRPWSVR